MAVDRSKIDQMVEEADHKAKSVQRAVTSLSFQLSGAQLGITISSLILGFILEGTVADLIRPALAAVGLPEASVRGTSLAIALAFVTSTQMVIGELIPKNLAIARPLPMALAVSTPLRAINAAFKPLIVFLNAAANWTVRLLGIEPREELIGVRSLEELHLLIHSSRERGSLPEEHASLLSRSITFGDKTAADALVPRTSIVTLQRDEPVATLIERALETGHSRFPVYGEDIDDVVGVAHVKDTYRIRPEERSSTPVSAIARDAPVVPETRTLDSLLLEMRRDRKQIAIVVDEYGGTAGLVTLEDLIEEIVGDIEDEYDPLLFERSTRPPQGVHVVSGMLHRDELADLTGFEMPEGDYETLAGFLLDVFDKVPEQGEHTTHEGWELKVVEMDRNRIARVLLVAPPPPEGDDRG